MWTSDLPKYQATGTQVSSEISRPLLVDASTQWEEPASTQSEQQATSSVCHRPRVFTSTPRKTNQQVILDSFNESPLKVPYDSPLKVPDDSPLKVQDDPPYHPTNQSFADAEAEEKREMTDAEAEEKRCSDTVKAVAAPIPQEDVAELHSARKFLVFEDQLLRLFNSCLSCSGAATGVVKSVNGSCITVERQCHNSDCNATSKWTSQPYINRMPAGNLITSAAILLSGSLPTKVLRLFTFMNLEMISVSTFHRHQSSYIIPTVIG